MISSINIHCQGESHKGDEKPCQDYSFSMASEDLSIAIVCDGHGGERYFRSQYGSQFATEVTVDVLKEFVAETDKKLLKGQPFTAKGVITSGEYHKPTNIDLAFQQMFNSIIARWRDKIVEHANNTPIDEWEKEHVPEKYLEEFVNQESLEKQYGCTLMAYAQTKHYWLAFHLGDGKCISFHDDCIWKEPIPWDDRCFLNKTTSICDSDAANEFRYCYEGDGKFPVAIFLGSDGIDDTYGEMENIANFYIEIMKLIAKDGVETARQQLKDDLPIISRIGSKDDCAVATVFAIDHVKSNIGRYVAHQVEYMTKQANEQKERIDKLLAKKENLDSILNQLISSKEKHDIEMHYTLQDLSKASERLEVLSDKIKLLAKEYNNLTGLTLDNIVDYSEIIETSGKYKE